MGDCGFYFWGVFGGCYILSVDILFVFLSGYDIGWYWSCWGVCGKWFDYWWFVENEVEIGIY